MEPPGFEDRADLQSDSGAPLLGRRPAAALKEFPPPISWLAARAPSHVPWEMKKYSTSDGRLIIKEERVKRHDYLLADRSNGRLVLSLVHVDDDNDLNQCSDAADEKRSPDTDGEDDYGENDLTVEQVPSECYKYSGGVKLKPCACGVFVATAPLFMPQLHI